MDAARRDLSGALAFQWNGAHGVPVSLRDDILMRVIHQLVEALLRAAGLRKKKDLPAAEEALGEGLQSLGLSLALIKSVPSATLKALVQDPTRRALLGAALCELAAIARDRGDEPGADQLDHTASDLFDDIDVSKLPDEVKDALPADMRESTW